MLGTYPITPASPLLHTLAGFKERYGKRVCLIGNVDCIEVLTSGSRDAVVEDVRRCLREGAANGGYMLSSSNAFHSATRPENFVAMVEALRRFGGY